jgi:hypothetical protein
MIEKRSIRLSRNLEGPSVKSDELKLEFIDYMLRRIPRGRFLRGRQSRQLGRLAGQQGEQLTTASVFDL